MRLQGALARTSGPLLGKERGGVYTLEKSTWAAVL